ncbi:MAG: SUMF1/EgtB/PvdO family nonheme iron enzyme [Polyangiaceae bacterium]|nr:SUMF1/EgtB/PvdO family nonheme iron enzyme [Polyangiaceae bacterium]
MRVSPCWLAETPVTNAQYRKFVEATGHEPGRYAEDRRFGGAGQPVVGVSWHDAVAFSEWLGKQSGRSVVLPSEAQREFAARGEEGRKYPWGKEEPDESRARFGLRWDRDAPAEVGSYPAGRGPFGHLDLAGNVWEWCRDSWDAQAYAKRAQARQEAMDPEVTGQSYMRCLRGGCFVLDAQFLRSAYRAGGDAVNRLGLIGFRVALFPASVGS